MNCFKNLFYETQKWANTVCNRAVRKHHKHLDLPTSVFWQPIRFTIMFFISIRSHHMSILPYLSVIGTGKLCETRGRMRFGSQPDGVIHQSNPWQNEVWASKRNCLRYHLLGQHSLVDRSPLLET